MSWGVSWELSVQQSPVPTSPAAQTVRKSPVQTRPTACHWLQGQSLGSEGLGLELVSLRQGLQERKQAPLPREVSWGPEPSLAPHRLLAQGCQDQTAQTGAHTTDICLPVWRLGVQGQGAGRFRPW